MYERVLLGRARTILGNMAAENSLKWWEFWRPRWTIPHEPLRADARNLVSEIDGYLEAVECRKQLRHWD